MNRRVSCRDTSNPGRALHNELRPQTQTGSRFQVRTKNDPTLAVCNCSFEHVLQHVGRTGLLSTSSEGLSATIAALCPVIV